MVSRWKWCRHIWPGDQAFARRTAALRSAKPNELIDARAHQAQKPGLRPWVFGSSPRLHAEGAAAAVTSAAPMATAVEDQQNQGSHATHPPSRRDFA